MIRCDAKPKFMDQAGTEAIWWSLQPRLTLDWTNIKPVLRATPVIEQVISAYTRNLKKIAELSLIESTCKICGEVRLASHADCSLEDWERDHSLQHDAAGSTDY